MTTNTPARPLLLVLSRSGDRAIRTALRNELGEVLTDRFDPLFIEQAPNAPGDAGYWFQLFHTLLSMCDGVVYFDVASQSQSDAVFHEQVLFETESLRDGVADKALREGFGFPAEAVRPALLAQIRVGSPEDGFPPHLDEGADGVLRYRFRTPPDDLHAAYTAHIACLDDVASRIKDQAAKPHFAPAEHHRRRLSALYLREPIVQSGVARPAPWVSAMDDALDDVTEQQLRFLAHALVHDPGLRAEYAQMAAFTSTGDAVRVEAQRAQRRILQDMAASAAQGRRPKAFQLKARALARFVADVARTLTGRGRGR